MKTFEEFCNSNILEVILNNHNEGGSRDVERLVQMAYDEYIDCPHLRHIDSYYLSDIQFFPPKLSITEKKLVKEHNIRDCYVDLDNADNWCIKTERYLFYKLKRTDSREDHVIASSKTFLLNREPTILKYGKLKNSQARQQEEEELARKLEESKRRRVQMPKMSGAGPKSRKATITDFFSKSTKEDEQKETDKEPPKSPMKKKLKMMRLFNEPSTSDRDMYRNSPTTTNEEETTDGKDIDGFDSTKLKPGPASRKKIIIEQYLQEVAAEKAKAEEVPIITIEDSPLEPSIPTVECDSIVPSSSTANPVVDIELEEIKDDFLLRKIPIKPGPKSKQKAYLERLQRQEAKIKAGPASKKRKALAKILGAKLNETQLEDQENIATKDSPVPEIRIDSVAQASPLQESLQPQENIQSSSGSEQNIEKGSPLWLLIYGKFDLNKKKFFEPDTIASSNLFPESNEGGNLINSPAHNVVAKFAPPCVSSPMPFKKSLEVRSISQNSPAQSLKNNIPSTSQVIPIDEPSSAIPIVLEKNIREVLHPKIFHFPELLRRITEMLVQKATLYEKKNSGTAVEEPVSENILPPNSGDNKESGDSVESPKDTQSPGEAPESGNNGDVLNESDKNIITPKIEKESQIPFFQPWASSLLDNTAGTSNTSQGSMVTVVEMVTSTQITKPTPAIIKSIEFLSPVRKEQEIEPEMIICDQLGTQSQVSFATQAAVNPLQTQEIIPSDGMEVDSEVVITTAPEQVIEIEDDSMTLEEILRQSPVKPQPNPTTPVKAKNASPQQTTPCRTPMTRSKLNTPAPEGEGTASSSTKKSSKKNPTKNGTPKKVEETKEIEEGDEKEKPESNPQSPKKTFRYNPLPLEHKGHPAVLKSNNKKNSQKRKRKGAATEDIYTMVRFEEETEGTAANLDIQDASMLLSQKEREDKGTTKGVPTRNKTRSLLSKLEEISAHKKRLAEGVSAEQPSTTSVDANLDIQNASKISPQKEEGDEGTTTVVSPRTRSTRLLNRLHEKSAQRARMSEGGSSEQASTSSTAKRFSFHQTTKLSYKKDDKGNFYSDSCGLCAMSVDVNVDGMRRLRFDVDDEDAKRYFLDLTQDQWETFERLMQRLDKFEFSGWAKEQAVQEASEDCCAIRRTLYCLLRTTPKLGVNVGAIRCSSGVGAKPVYLRRAPEEENRPETDLSKCIDPLVLKRMEELVKKRKDRENE